MAVRVAVRAAVLAAVLVGGSCDGAEREGRRGERGRDAAGVITWQVEHEPEVVRVEVVGTARARASAVIQPETGGEVAEVLFSAGEFTEAGAPLVRLEDRDQRLAARLARVAVQEAEQLLSRYRRIEDTGAVSDSQIDEARTALESARIELERAELALEKRTVKAPFAGYLGLTETDAGARVTPSTAITRLDDRRVLFIDFSPPEQVFGRIAPGDHVQVTPFGGVEETYQAEVVGVDSHIDPERRTFIVRTKIDNGKDTLRPGMSFRVSFRLEGNTYPAVPEAAIIWGSHGAYVWAVRDGVARQVTVTIVARRKGRVLVRGDIPEDSLVVAEGVQKVRDGSPVRIVERRNGTAESGAGQESE